MKSARWEILASLAAVALIAAVVWAAYENNYKGAFVFDDTSYIVENTSIKHLAVDSLGEDLSHIVNYDPFRSFTSLTFAWDYKYAGKEVKNGVVNIQKFSPFWFHVFNNYIHVIASVLVFFVARKIIMMYRGESGGWAGRYFPALIAALLFAACPVNTESVTYIVQRSESLCSMFILAGLLCFLHARAYQMKHYREEHAEEKSSRKTVFAPQPRTFAWVAAGVVFLLLVYMVVLRAVGAVDKTLSPAEFMIAQQKAQEAAQHAALLTTGALAAGYILAILILTFLFMRRVQWGGDLWLIAAYACFGLAALSKQIAVLFPFLLLLVEYAVLRAGRQGHMRKALKYHSLYLATLALGAILWLVLQGAPRNSAIQQEGQVDTRYFAQQVSNSVVLKYAGKMLLPLNLNIDPDIGLFGESPADRLISVEFAALVVLIVFAILLHKYSRLAGFGLIWFFVALIPSSSVLKLSDVMAEHRVYLAGFGLFLAVGVAVVEAVRLVPARAGRIAAAVLVALCVALIVAVDVKKVRDRNEKFYLNDNYPYLGSVTLWMDTIRYSPDKARPYTGVGYEYMNRGSVEPAMDDYNKARAAAAAYETDKTHRRDTPQTKEAVFRQCEETEGKLAGFSLQLATARAFLKTAELYDQHDLWLPRILILDNPVPGYSRFGRQHLARIYNNLGVTYSYQSEITQWERNLAGVVPVDEKALQSDLTYAWKEALRYYGMSLGVYAIGVEALVNSSKIQWAIGSEYFNMAANAPTQEEKNKYLGFFESDAAVSVALVHRAVMLDSNSAMALEQMSVVHRGLGLYYSGMAVAVDTALPQDVREKRALMHWRYFKWVSQYYPADPGILKTADEWIWRLQTKWPNEPDPITGEVQQ